MNDYGLRFVINTTFETTVGAVCRSIRDEGLQVLARSDVREHFWRHLSREFRHYVLIEAWSPDLALEALRNNLDAGVILTTTFAIYEVDESETAVVVKEYSQNLP
jgi:uncharacterized protein (DUF302 family)